MKPTSIVCLIIAAVLIVCGVVVCFVGSTLAKKDDISLYADYVDADKNEITEFDVSTNSISDLTIDLKNANVKIVGGEKFDVKTINYPRKTYDFEVSNSKCNITEVNLLKGLLSSFKISESGFKFNGLRDYLALGRYKGKDRIVEITLPRTGSITNLNINVKNGNVNIENIEVALDMNVTVESGDITMYNVKENGKAIIETGKGIVNFDYCRMKDSEAKVLSTGSVNVIEAVQHSLTLKTNSGSIYIDSTKYGLEYMGVYPTKVIDLLPPEDDSQVVTEEPATEDTAASEENAENSEETAEASGEEETENTEDTSTILPMGLKIDVNIGDIKIQVAQ